MIRTPLLAAAVLLAALAGAQGTWTKAETLAKLMGATPIKVDEVSRLISTLSSTDRDIRSASLRFWATRARETQEVLEHDLNDAEESDGAMERFCESVVSLVDASIDSPDPEIHRSAIRTLCSLGEAAVTYCPFRPGCGFGFERTFHGHSFQRLSARGRAFPSDFLTLAFDPNADVGFNGLYHCPDHWDAAFRARVVALLHHEDQLHRAMALYLFEPQNDQDLLRVTAQLFDDPSERVRDSALDAIVHKLKDPDLLFSRRHLLTAQMRRGLVTAIANRQSPHRSDMLLSFLQDEDGEVRGEALENTCSNLPEERLREFFNDVNAKVREAALAGLYASKQDVAPIFLKALGDPDGRVRQWAAAWLDDKGFDLRYTQVVIKAIESDGELWLSRYFLAPENDRYLDGWLASTNLNVRRAAVSSFGYCDESDRKRVLPRLLRLTAEKDSAIREAVISGLSRFECHEASLALQEMASSAGADELVSIIEGLGTWWDPGSLALVRKYVNSEDKPVAKAAKAALKSLTERAPPPPASR